MTAIMLGQKKLQSQQKNQLPSSSSFLFSLFISFHCQLQLKFQSVSISANRIQSFRGISGNYTLYCSRPATGLSCEFYKLWPPTATLVKALKIKVIIQAPILFSFEINESKSFTHGASGVSPLPAEVSSIRDPSHCHCHCRSLLVPPMRPSPCACSSDASSPNLDRIATDRYKWWHRYYKERLNKFRTCKNKKKDISSYSSLSIKGLNSCVKKLFFHVLQKNLFLFSKEMITTIYIRRVKKSHNENYPQ